MAVFEEEIKQSKKFPSEQERAIVNLIYTSNRLHDELNTLFIRHGLTHQQYNVLRILRGRYPDPLNCTAIREVMLDKSPDVTRLCDRLEAKELVARKENKENRREIHIKITRKGLTLLENIEPLMRDHMVEVANITEEEATQLNLLLDKLRG